MSSRLKHMVKILVSVALAMMVVAVVPAAAEAQGTASTKDASSSPPSASAPPNYTSMVVRPGDCLWSISQERVGPNATPQQILTGVEQIYTLNRNRIGADPNLIFVGQKLLLPPTSSEFPTGSTEATTTRNTTEVTETAPAGRSTRSAADGKGPSTALGGATAKDTKGARSGEAFAPVAEPLTLPDLAAAPVPAVGSLTPNDKPLSPVASFFTYVHSGVASAASAVTALDGRQLFGPGVLLLALVVAVLMAWKRLTRRILRWNAREPIPDMFVSVEERQVEFIVDPDMLRSPRVHDSARRLAKHLVGREAEVWISCPLDQHEGSDEIGADAFIVAERAAPASPEDSPGHQETAERKAAPDHPAQERRGVPTWRGDAPAGNGGIRNGATATSVTTTSAAAVHQARRPETKAVVRNRLALGVYSPDVRRTLQRTRAAMRARGLRPQGGVARQPSSLAADKKGGEHL